MSCQNQLYWYELIPVFSFLGLQGRCRNCKTKISPQYPLVELATGLVFAGLFLKFQGVFYLDILAFTITYAYYAAAFSLLLVIAVYDLKHTIIPDSLVFIFGALAFVGLFLFHDNALYWQMPSILEFLSGPIMASPFALFWLVSRGRWMGFGDAKLALGIGWLLTPLGLTVAFSALAVAFWSGAIIGLALVFISKCKKIINIGMKSEVPFAPFLVFGTFLAFIFEFNFFGI